MPGNLQTTCRGLPHPDPSTVRRSFPRTKPWGFPVPPGRRRHSCLWPPCAVSGVTARPRPVPWSSRAPAGLGSPCVRRRPGGRDEAVCGRVGLGAAPGHGIIVLCCLEEQWAALSAHPPPPRGLQSLCHGLSATSDCGDESATSASSRLRQSPRRRSGRVCSGESESGPAPLSPDGETEAQTVTSSPALAKSGDHFPGGWRGWGPG